jgi:hypothetical protein
MENRRKQVIFDLILSARVPRELMTCEPGFTLHPDKNNLISSLLAMSNAVLSLKFFVFRYISRDFINNIIVFCTPPSN